MQNRIAKKVVKHKVNKAMGNQKECCTGCNTQCLLGRFTILSGAVSNAVGIAVGVGSLFFLADNTLNASFTVMIIANSVSLVTFCSMLLVSFTMPNERYAPLFGFLQLAIGKATLMSFAGIQMIAAAILFLNVKGKEYAGYLILIGAGMEYVSMLLIIARSCCYADNQEKVWGGSAVTNNAQPRAVSKGSRGANTTPVSNPVKQNRDSGGDFGGNQSAYKAPTASSQPKDTGDEFGSDNPFGSPSNCESMA